MDRVRLAASSDVTLRDVRIDESAFGVLVEDGTTARLRT
jgi:hypothetical protein